MLTVLAFAFALGLLIAIHEYGHYRAAVACNVRVLRFSIGFGPVVLRWKSPRPRPGQDTEFVLCALPLGGYVRMLDEREGPVDPAAAHRAFNRAPLRARAFIVSAGPLANLLLAVLLYSLVAWTGVQEPRALLSAPLAGSVAERAGLTGGEEVVAAAFDDEAPEPVASFDALRWMMLRAAMDGRDLRLQLGPAAPGGREVRLPLSQLAARDADAALVRRIGIVSPLTRPVLGALTAGGAAERAGLQPGDRVLAVGGRPIVDGQQLREWIRQQGAAAGVGAAADSPARALPTVAWRIERAGRELVLEVTPDRVSERGQDIGRIGALVGAAPEMVEVRQGALASLAAGAERTWEVSTLTLRMIGRMVVGQASLANLSGPLSIADYAGKSASQGLSQYIVFLAMISVSLGVLNLLPLPVLDGGHLMYYLWEAVTGKGVSDAWTERLQRAGVVILLVMMSIALFNDFSRLLINP